MSASESESESAVRTCAGQGASVELATREEAEESWDKREEQDALRLSLSDRRFHAHLKTTHRIFQVLCVVSLLASALLLLATVWQRAQFHQLQQDFQVMSHVSQFGEIAQRVLRAGHMRVYTNASDPVSGAEFDAEFASYTSQQLSQRDVVLEYVSDQQYGGDFRDGMQQAIDSVQEMETLLQSLWTQNASDAIHTAELSSFRDKVTSVSAFNEEALTLLSDEAKDRHDYALTVNTVSFVATLSMLALVALGFALLVFRLVRLRAFNDDVLHALEACQMHDDEKSRSSGREDSVSRSHTTSSSSEGESFPAESIAERKLKRVTRVMKTVFTVFMLVSLAVFAVLCVSIVSVRHAIVANSSFEVKSSWTQLPAHFERINTLSRLVLYSSFPFPNWDWVQEQTRQMMQTMQLVAHLTCAQGGTASLQELFAGAINDMLALAAPLIVQQGVTLNAGMIVTMQEVVDSGCVMASLDVSVERCYIEELPRALQQSSGIALNDAVKVFSREFVAVGLGSAVEFLPPLTHASLPPAVLATVPAGAPDPLVCYECEDFFLVRDYCSDELLVHMMDESGMVAEELQTLAQTLLNLPQLVASLDGNVALRQDFLDLLNALNADQLRKAESWNVVSIVAVAVSVPVVILSCVVILLQARRRKAHEAVVRKEQEWSMHRLLHNQATADLLQEFAAVQFAEENVMFYRECERVRRQRWTPHDTTQLYLQFIKTGSPREINIPNRRREPIEHIMEKRAGEAGQTPEHISKECRKLIQSAQRNISDLMAFNLHAGFITWPRFREWEAERQRLVQNKVAIMRSMSGIE